MISINTQHETCPAMEWSALVLKKKALSMGAFLSLKPNFKTKTNFYDSSITRL
jgi:hypothetical protein